MFHEDNILVIGLKFIDFAEQSAHSEDILLSWFPSGGKAFRCINTLLLADGSFNRVGHCDKFSSQGCEALHGAIRHWNKETDKMRLIHNSWLAIFLSFTPARHSRTKQDVQATLSISKTSMETEVTRSLHERNGFT